MSGRRHAPPPAITDLGQVIIDGDNLLHRVRGNRDEAGVAWLLPLLRAWRPPDVEIVVMLDGAPDPGAPRRQRAAPGIAWEHSGRVDADTAIVGMCRARPYADRARTVVVTDDRGLTERCRMAGVLVRRLDWLVDQLGRPGGSGPGRGRGEGRGTPASAGSSAGRRPVGIGARPPRLGVPPSGTAPRQGRLP
jgi:hypothetical protein